MALVKGTNSFADVADFDAYFADRLDVAEAISATPDQKYQALISATDLLNELRWVGVAVSDTQPLAFPRNGSYFDPRAGRVVSIVDTPMRVQNACMELAYHLIHNEGLQDISGTADAISVGPISITKPKNPSVIPSKVYTMIQPLLVNRGASIWWRAN